MEKKALQKNEESFSIESNCFRGYDLQCTISFTRRLKHGDELSVEIQLIGSQCWDQRHSFTQFNRLSVAVDQ